MQAPKCPLGRAFIVGTALAMSALSACAPPPPSLSVSVHMQQLATHTAQLYFAARAHDGPAVRYEAAEIDETIEALERSGARERGIVVGEAVRARVWPQLKQLPIDDDALFALAFDGVIASCNACHRETGNEAVRVGVPTSPPVPMRVFGTPAAHTRRSE